MRVLLLLLVPLLPGCLSCGWRRATSFSPPPRDAIAALVPGRSTLADCLELLGAPLHVWEHKGEGAALAWGWAESSGWGLSLSVPVYRQASASLSWDDLDARMNGLVLVFDEDWKLDLVREGYLRDLRAQLVRRRPAPAPVAEAGPG